VPISFPKKCGIAYTGSGILNLQLTNQRFYLKAHNVSAGFAELGTGSVQFIIQVIDLKHYKSHGNKVASS